MKRNLSDGLKKFECCFNLPDHNASKTFICSSVVNGGSGSDGPPKTILITLSSFFEK